MKKSISIVLVFVILFTMVSSLTGCSNAGKSTTTNNVSSTGQADSKANKKISKIGLSVMTLGNEYFMGVKESMETLAAKDNVEVITVSYENDVAKQIEQIENLVTMKVDAIVVYVMEWNSLKDCLREARKKGVKILVVGAIPEEKDCYDMVVTVDQYLVGKTSAELAAKWIDETFPNAPAGSIEVAIFGLSATPDTKQCSDALKEVEKLTSKAKIVNTFDLSGSANWAPKSQEYAELMLIQNPNIKVALCYIDGIAIAVDEVIMRNSTVDKSKFGIFSCGLTEAVCKALIKSKTNESTYRAEAAFSPDSGKEYYEAIMGQLELNEDNVYFSPVFVVTAENAADYIAK